MKTPHLKTDTTYNNHEEIKFNVPVLFNNKNKKNIVNKLTHVYNDTGKTRHYTPAAQEWYNSIYSYEPNYAKTLPVLDTNLIDLLKSYFNFEIKRKVLKTKPLATRFKRLTTKRVFVGKGDIKHTSNKAIVTFYIYNTTKLYLSRVRFLIRKLLCNNIPLRQLIKIEDKKDKNKIEMYNIPLGKKGKPFLEKELRKMYSIDNNKENLTISYNRPFATKEFLDWSAKDNKMNIDHSELYIPFKNACISNRFNWIDLRLDLVNKRLSYLNMYYNLLSKMVKLNLIDEEKKNKIFLFELSLNSWLLNSKDPFGFLDSPYDLYTVEAENYYISFFNLDKYNTLLQYNYRLKFNQLFISKLTGLVQEIYKKKIEFNFVNLRKMHLNSDIYTQAVALKLKNNKNRLFRVLKSSLRKVKIASINKKIEKFHQINKDDLYVNKIRNDNISTMFNDKVNDPLNNLLLSFFPFADDLKSKIVKRWSTKNRNISFKSYILNSLKHLNMRGIRVEAKGRLTRRFTASRSVFKMKWKGGLKNVDSSFKGLSTIMLRGHVKSNIQYTFINSKNRIGAYGVKGWVSSR
jgi:Mitochondrial ribosomal protein (VAR1)